MCNGKIYTSEETCPEHGGFHICRGVMYDSEDYCPRHSPVSKERNETPWRSLWWWTTFEIPKEKKHREDFISLIVLIVILETIAGPLIGMILRSIFGWPF